MPTSMRLGHYRADVLMFGESRTIMSPKVVCMLPVVSFSGAMSYGSDMARQRDSRARPRLF